MIYYTEYGKKIFEENCPEATVLGKNVKAPVLYDPSVLVAVPRSVNRDKYEITSEMFSGFDWLNCYECSSLDMMGVPFYFAMSIKYPSNTTNIIESKSLKLYLNSFNMSRIGNIRDFQKIVVNDLSKILGINGEEVVITNLPYLEDLKRYKSLNDACDVGLINIHNVYNENQELIIIYNVNNGYSRWRFEGFRSNCKITGAPDFATVFIEIQGNEQPTPESLLRYLISYRNEAHFHEECCELIYKRLLEWCSPKYLYVRCNYTRRGGIDIVPVRETYTTNPKYHFATVTRTEFQ